VIRFRGRPQSGFSKGYERDFNAVAHPFATELFNCPSLPTDENLADRKFSENLTRTSCSCALPFYDGLPMFVQIVMP
jgi:hypothetical protein